MTNFPDILGMELHAAKALLEAEGLTFIVKETKPAKKEQTEGNFRIIKVQLTGKQADGSAVGDAIITVCKV